jgi:flagellin-like protein
MQGAARCLGSRGVSQVIAALLLIAIVVAAAVFLYVYSLGLSGRLGNGGGQQIGERLILAVYRWSGNPGVLTGVVKNVGQTSLGLGGTDVFLSAVRINGGLGGGCASVTLDPSQSCDFQFAVPAGSWISGAAYSLKLVTPSGGIFSYSVIQGGSG